MYEFVCEHLIPGCTTRESGDSKAAVKEQARRHLSEHHETESVDQALWKGIDLAIVTIRSR